MFIISGGRGTGKTKALLERAATEGGIVVCRDPEKLRERAYRYGIVGLDIVGYGDLYVAGKPVYIHDINKYLKYLDSKVQGYSLSLD